MNDYRFMKFPGKNFQSQMTTNKNTIKKLSTVLNMYTGYNKTPAYVPMLLKIRFQPKDIYKGFIGIALLSLCLFILTDLSYVSVITGFIFMALTGICLNIFYTEATEYKMLNTLVAKSKPEDIIKHSKKLNTILRQEKKPL